MVNLVSTAIPYLVLVSHLLLAFLVIVSIFRESWGKQTSRFIGQNAVKLALAVAVSAVFGSLFYSEIIGFVPCPLCWWQRIFLFPLPVILAVSLWKKDSAVFKYIVPLAILGTMVALYHSYFELGGSSLLPCTAEGGACSRVYVKEFGYITIPTMSLTSFAFVLVISWFKKQYEKNRNA
jgi:disulfide bond formation protein DsbB